MYYALIDTLIEQSFITTFVRTTYSIYEPPKNNNYVTGFWKSVSNHTITEIHSIAIATLKYYPDTVSI